MWRSREERPEVRGPEVGGQEENSYTRTYFLAVFLFLWS